MSKDEHKRRIKGFHGGGKVCWCCPETTKKEANRLARRRLKHADRVAQKEAA